MTDERKELLKAFAANTEMLNAVREELLSGMIGEDFSRNNWVFGIDRKQSDTAFGKEVKITAKALEWINSGFDRIKRYAPSSPQPVQENRAR